MESQALPLVRNFCSVAVARWSGSMVSGLVSVHAQATVCRHLKAVVMMYRLRALVVVSVWCAQESAS